MCCAVTTTMVQTYYGITVWSLTFPAALSLSLSNTFRDALGYKDACSKFACLQREREIKKEWRMQEKNTRRHIVQTAL